ncbi:MAG: type II toxin-antitoxin system HicB family antitoxin [Eggerthellaceae bacterium]|jgi:predicted HicB family RNase H-like nuclease|nr:type II toxin-antitoxin system HicB family antitoxin [Eggerthellaceae bacterium]
MHSAEEYTYRVFWSEEDDSFVATVVEFPGLSSIEDTQEKALFGMVELLRFLLGEMEKDGDDPPAPMGAKHFSGEIRLRMPKEVHKRVAIEAAEQGVSINQLLVSRI